MTFSQRTTKAGRLIRAWAARVWRRGHLGPVLVFVAVACAMMAPYAGGRLRESTASDLSVHCSGIVEAYNALAEGQFPIRVAPSHKGGDGGRQSGVDRGTDLGGVRYPLFQFYGQLPYTAGGLLCFAFGVNAFTAWKLVQLAALTLGGFFAYRCGVAATRRPRASLVAGVVFVTAPYMWADLHARFAFTELVSFNLLPVVTFFAQRAFASRRWAHVLLGGVAWSLLALSHNVTFLYASALLGLYFASHLSFSRRFAWRITRVGLGYGLGIVLTLWYHVPQFYTLPLLNIRVQGEHPRPVGAELLTPLDVLLAPTLKSPPGSPTERLGLQVGLPALAAAGLAPASLFWRRRNRGTVARLLVFFAVAFLITWSPPPTAGGFDLWRLLPSVFAYVQSSYRILMFVTLFAALLVPYALAIRRGRDLPAWATPLVLIIVAASSLSYVPPRHEPLPSDALARLVAEPLLEGLRDYLIHPEQLARTSVAHPPGRAFVSAEEVLGHRRLGAPREYEVELGKPSLVQLPVLYYPRLLRVRVNGEEAASGNVGRFVAIDLPKGRHEVGVAFVGVRWANWLSAAAWIGVVLAFIPVARDALRRGARPHLRMWEAPFAAVLLFGIIGAVPVADAVRRGLYVPLDCTAFTSRASLDEHPPSFALDGEETTHWAVPGGAPASLTVLPAKPGKFRRIALSARRSGLWEAWHKVRVELYLRNRLTLDKQFNLPDASTEGEQVIRFDAARADRIVLHFSDPVTVTRDGGTRVDPNAVSPGYREIRIE